MTYSEVWEDDGTMSLLVASLDRVCDVDEGVGVAVALLLKVSREVLV